MAEQYAFRQKLRPSLEERFLRKQLFRKILSNIDTEGIRDKLELLAATRRDSLTSWDRRVVDPHVATEPSPIPAESHDLEMWWGRTTIINMPNKTSATTDFHPDGLHITADLTATSGNAWAGSVAVLA